MSLFSALFAIVLITLGATADERPTNVQLVHVFFRHGARTPELKHVFPTDPYRTTGFPDIGWGQLTNMGKRGSHRLGQVLRQRYAALLGDAYAPGVVKAHSTDYDRTKMTVLLVLAGLFPPTPSQTWNDAIPWQPIPYHYTNGQIDYTLRRPTKYCPTYLKELNRVYSSEAYRRELKAHGKLLEYVEQHTGKPAKKLKSIFDVYQTLTAEAALNLTLPDWTKSVFPGEIDVVAGKQCMYENYNSVLKRLNGGRMLGRVVAQMEERAKRSVVPEEDTKIYLYSGHENNVLNVLAALDAFEAHVPNYTAAVIIELHFIPEANEYGVKVLYLRDLKLEPEVQKLEGCDVLCPLNSFIQITQGHVPVNYTAECLSHVHLG